MLACYTDVLSCYPGENAKLFASSTANGFCSLEVARVGRNREVVLTADQITVKRHDVPARPDLAGCGWPAAFTIEVGVGWRSGYYDIALHNQMGESAHHFLCVKPAKDAARTAAALILSTNTYHAYNWWGGANAYCDVTSLMSRAKALPQAMEGAIGTLSTRRPFAPLVVAPPADTPRLVNMRPRRFLERPWAGSREWARLHRPSPYDRSAGFLNKWEHAFVAWAEENGVALDYFTDFDVDQEADALDPYRAAILVGHSEYWSAPQRDNVERFVERGGKLAVFSGNTCFWKVRWENSGGTLICHKWRGLEAEPNAGQAATHLWSHPNFGKPEASLFGLSFLFAGYHRLGMCAARGAGGYTVYRDRHWSLEGADLFYGDVIAPELPLLGYENDGCRFEFADDGLPKSIPVLGVPENLEIIALAPCALGEQLDSGYPPLIPREKLDVCARIVYGNASRETQERMLRGHAAMASFTRGNGEVFNCGTTEWAHALKAKDPYVQRITRNVLRRFGVV
jgi:hypothetical protein